MNRLAICLPLFAFGSDCPATGQSLLQHGRKQSADFPPAAGKGGSLRASQLEGHEVCNDDSYRSSALEARFLQQPVKQTETKEVLCQTLGADAENWIQMNLEQTTLEDEKIFSKMCRTGRTPQLIEPLAGILRDPRVFCDEQNSDSFFPQNLFSIDWLVLADSGTHSNTAKRFFFDAGGSHFRDATMFFAQKYEERGLPMDHIYVWEAEKQDLESYWEGTPPEVRQKWESRVTFYNGVPVTNETTSANNPVSRIHDLCGKDDFCAFKLDIDHPELESSLAEQLLSNPGHLKEFFFEQHVHGLMQDIWEKGGDVTVEGTVQTTYELFQALRQKGVRAHSWI
ncbi:unnamed protein product [Effrenium voratum]|nr:unnamed protein product [Effrenium voratum]|eukprot:CAMPEP_0181452546 /NCGR_PEP_ID=MMETSP1110-20121109/29262_1 /TAXON_ID=174948 /ORGANISM="Symbiodinium sp., Strain CCMP421" /LENGTH=339 /DNA_ID=CAMNT_0023576831 /DNA_START=35 /DNA_END=1054 /DNA_ORIENTATION=-